MSKTLSAEAEHKPYFTTKRMALIGVMTAVTCILGPFSIPLPFSPVPISFTNLAIYLAAYVLGMKACTVSYLIYMLLGMVGVPVFSGFTAGVGKLAGPTGGYLVGFILMALIVGGSFSGQSSPAYRWHGTGTGDLLYFRNGMAGRSA